MSPKVAVSNLVSIFLLSWIQIDKTLVHLLSWWIQIVKKIQNPWDTMWPYPICRRSHFPFANCRVPQALLPKKTSWFLNWKPCVSSSCSHTIFYDLSYCRLCSDSSSDFVFIAWRLWLCIYCQGILNFAQSEGDNAEERGATLQDYCGAAFQVAHKTVHSAN